MDYRNYLSRNFGDFDIVISREQYFIRVFWARIIGPDSRSLLTDYTRHTFFEAEVVLEGSMDFLIGSRECVTVPESHFVIIPPDTFHQVTGSCGEGARLILAFSLETGDSRLNGAISSPAGLRPFKCSDAMISLLDVLIGKEYEDTTVRRSLISSVVEAFLLEMFDIVVRDSFVSAPTASGDRAVVKDVVSYIKSKHGVGVSVDSLSKRFFISKRHLCRLFTEQTGTNVRENINHEKLMRIEELAVSTNLSLHEIAELCEFCDEYSMNKFFRRYNLINLSEFRKLRKKS